MFEVGDEVIIHSNVGKISNIGKEAYAGLRGIIVKVHEGYRVFPYKIEFDGRSNCYLWNEHEFDLVCSPELNISSEEEFDKFFINEVIV